MSTRDEFELKPISKPKPNSVKPKKPQKKKKKDNQRKERKATQTLAIVLGELTLILWNGSKDVYIKVATKGITPF